VFVFVRALTYASLFVGLLLVFVPRQILTTSGLLPPPQFGPLGLSGVAVAIAGAALAVWCILAFIVQGQGTPAPFDPPRRLVTKGPYQFVRNPMYLGAGLALGGASLVYRSLGLLAYSVAFLLAVHFFVLLYEEPTLLRLFGTEYEDYRRRVGRWLPKW